MKYQTDHDYNRTLVSERDTLRFERNAARWQLTRIKMMQEAA
jgi:hypothetical protein